MIPSHSTRSNLFSPPPPPSSNTLSANTLTSSSSLPLSVSYSPHRRVPHYLKHSHRATNNMGTSTTSMMMSNEKHNIDHQQHPTANENEQRDTLNRPLFSHDAAATPGRPPRKSNLTNGTRAWFEQDAETTKDAASLQLQSPLRKQRATPQHPHQPSHHTHQHLMPMTLQHTPTTNSTNTSHTATPFTATPTSTNHSFASSSSSSSSSGSIDRSVLGLSFHGFTSPSPVQPHHLSFDAAVNSPIDDSKPATPSLTLAPFAFATTSSSSSSSFPSINVPHTTAPVTRTAARFRSNGSTIALDTNEVSHTVHTTPNSARPHPSPLFDVMDVGSSSPPPNSSSHHPFVSPVCVRVISKDGAIRAGSAAASRARELLASPSPIVGTAASPRVKQMMSGASSSAASSTVGGIHRKHTRGSSVDGLSSSTSPSSAFVGAGVRSSRRGGPLLNSKRSRGYSMDLEAELDAGGELPTNLSNFIYGQESSLLDSTCPSEAITQSMRKLKVKKSFPESPLPIVRGQRRSTMERRRERRNSGFSSSEDEKEETSEPTRRNDTLHQTMSYGTSLDGSSSSSSLTLPSPIEVPMTQNMKQLRRLKQLQSVQKKREAAAEAAAAAASNNEDGMKDDTHPTPTAASSSAHHRHSSHRSSLSMDAGYFSLPPVDSSATPTRRHTLVIDIPNTLKGDMTIKPLDGMTPIQPSPLLPLDPLGSPPPAHASDLKGRLSWSSDDDEEEDEDDHHARLRPLAFSLLPATREDLTPLKPLPPCEDEMIDTHHPSSHRDDDHDTDSPAARVLDFGSSAAAAAADADERRDTMTDELKTIRTMSRCGSFRVGGSNSGSDFFPASSNPSQHSTPQTRSLVSPIPHHTPLTPAPTNSTLFSFHLPTATPLPLLPGMAPPQNRMQLRQQPNSSQHLFSSSSSLASSPSDPLASPQLSETDFLSPTSHNHTMGGGMGAFDFAKGVPPNMSPLTSTGSYLLADTNFNSPRDVEFGQLTPAAVTVLSPPSTCESQTHDGSHDSITFEPMLSRSLSDVESHRNTNNGYSSPSSTPPRDRFLNAPNTGFLCALSPDPKAFIEAQSLAPRKTPARGKLQPPPTPIRPSSIKRSVVKEERNNGPSKLGLSSAKLLALALSSPDSPKKSSLTSHRSGVPSVAAPLYLPPLRGGRLERTSSLYDSKVLIDFKAHIDAAAAAKKKSMDENTVDEHGDTSMDSDPDSSFTLHTTIDSDSAVPPHTVGSSSLIHPTTVGVSAPLGVTAPAPSVSSSVGVNVSVSIWETQFTNKVLVGSGSFFQTYRCQGNALKEHPDEYGEFFAVKRSIKEFRGKKDRGLYLREIAVMESIGHHENIVKHIRAWQEDLHFFIQMEFCPMNLSEYIFSLQQSALCATTPRGTHHVEPNSNPYRLSDGLLKNITLQLASALHHIHQRNLIHLDVKPDNVLVSYTGILRLADFGQARLVRPDGTSVSDDSDLDGVEGDSIFMAPELLDPSSAGLSGPTSAADIFSLGLLLVELASGVSLPKSGEIWHDLRQGRAHQHIHTRVTPQMEHIILNLLEPNPKKRPSAKTLLEWLETHHEE